MPCSIFLSVVPISEPKVRIPTTHYSSFRRSGGEAQAVLDATMMQFSDKH
jgi:hypothetical protein